MINDADIEMAQLHEAGDMAAAGVCYLCETPLNPLHPKWTASYARDRARNPKAPSATDDAEYYGPVHPSLPAHVLCVDDVR